MEKNTKASVASNKDNFTEVNAGGTKYMAMSRDQNAGRTHNIKRVNKSFEIEKQLKYFGKILTYQNYIRLNINYQRDSRNILSVYSSVQNV